MIRLQTVLDSWRAVRQDTAQAVSDFPEASLDDSLLEGCMSARQTAVHILQASHGLAGAMLAGADNFVQPNMGEFLAPYMFRLPENASRQDLAEALVESLRDRTADLQEQPGQFWGEEVTRFDGQRVTRMEMLQSLKEHEMTHRSQLFMFLRLKGIVPPTTRRREAARRQQA